jgi:hypothetical protein
MTNDQLVLNNKHRLTEIIVSFNGAVDATEADSLATYQLTAAGRKGSFTARNAKHINLRSAVYDAANNTVTLTPRKAFSPSKPVLLVIDGAPPSGLLDTFGRFIDGGKNAEAVLRRTGVTIISELLQWWKIRAGLFE